jgi:hypothetical protein
MNCIRLFVAVALVAVLSGQSRADFIVNGGFETGDFTGWTGWTSSNDFAGVDSSFNGYTPHSGSFFAFAGPVGGVSFLSQTFADPVVGEPLTINLFMQADGFTPNEFTVVFNGNTLYDQVNVPSQPWTPFTFTALSATSNTLQIGIRDDPSYIAIDDVSVTGSPAAPPAVPAPPAIAILGGGFAGLGLIRRLRKA